MAETEFLSRADVASRLGVSPSTISRWARKGHLSWVGTAGGHRRYPRDEVKRLESRLFGAQRQRAGVLEQLEEMLKDPSYPADGEDAVAEIRFHGRAGQGLITAGEILAEAALRDGKYFQAFPEFGPERSGAPMEAFVRISSTPIHTRAPALRPGIVVIFDSTLVGEGSVLRGTDDGSLVVVNHASSPEDLRRSVMALERFDLATVDATGIALEALKRPIPNVPMLGALLRLFPVVPPELVEEAIVHLLGRRVASDKVEANRSAFWQGHANAQVGRVHGERVEVYR